MHARYADLVVLGQVNPDEPPYVGHHLPPQVVLSSGRPVLLVPYIGAPATLGRRVVVARDASREAARAVSDAHADPGAARTPCTWSSSVPRARRSATAKCRAPTSEPHLARHGVKVEVERVEPGTSAVGNALLSHIADRGADLLVMGAYAHSRVRELVLGGATRTILESMTLPVLMAH